MDKEKWIEEKGGVKKFIIEGKYLSLEKCVEKYPINDIFR